MLPSDDPAAAVAAKGERARGDPPPMGLAGRARGLGDGARGAAREASAPACCVPQPAARCGAGQTAGRHGDQPLAAASESSTAGQGAPPPKLAQAPALGLILTSRLGKLTYSSRLASPHATPSPCLLFGALRCQSTACLLYCHAGSICSCLHN